MERLWKLIKDEDGLETPEYAVMGALIVVGLVATVILLRGSIIQTFSDMTSAIGRIASAGTRKASGSRRVSYR